MANAFDQFDAPTQGASGNPFDQFDSPAGDELKSRAKAAVGGVEGVATMLGNMPATIAGGLLGGSNFLATGDIDKARRIQQRVEEYNFGFGKAEPVSDYGKLAQQGFGEAQGYVHDKAGEAGHAVGGSLGQATGEFAADATMNFLPVPGGKFVGAVGKGLRREFGRPEPKGIDLSKLDETPTPKAEANPFDQFDNQPPVMQVTPEGQAFDPRNVPDIARQRAADMQAHAQDALDRSTQDITYENVPPDGVIPRSRPDGSLRVPSRNEWVADENGMPVRQGMPEEPAGSPPVQDVNIDQPHVNDMGNAIQEANGPKLGPDETYGAGQMNIPSGQRGAIDFNALPETLLEKFRKWKDAEEAIHAPSNSTTGTLKAKETMAFRRLNTEVKALTKGDTNAGLELLRHLNSKQRGAIDLQAVQDGFRKLTGGELTPEQYALRFSGAFDKRSMENALDDLHDPKARSTLVLMSPDEFQKMAAHRDADWMSGPGSEMKRESIRQGLKSDSGLTNLPQLWVKEGPKNSMQVWGHEGRHRMDVFKEMGVDKVPVIVRHDTMRWGETSPESIPARMRAEEGSSLPRNMATPKPIRQRGGIDADAVHKALQSGMDKFGKFIEDVGGTRLSPHTPQEKVVVDALGTRNYIPRGDAPEDIIAAASKEQDSKGLWTNLQSGLQSAGDKVRSSLMTGVARWLSYGEKMGDRYYNQKVGPLERTLKGLSSDDLIAGQAALRKGLADGKEYTDAQLKAAGLSDKAIAAHNEMRQAFKDALDVTNASLRALGRKEVKPQEAYMASMWHGNWHVPIRDTEGRLAWYIKAETKAEATKAINYLKNNKELSATLDLSGTEAKYHPENIGLRAPADVMGAYQDMLSLFEGDTAAHMKQAMEAYMEGQGFRYLQHQKHFQNKTNVRGFMGDRPWLSDKDNAMTQARAQVAYLKEAYRWAPMQEALAQVKQVLSDPGLNKSQPNNMALTKAYTAQAMGVSKNMFNGIEQAMQKAMTSGPGPLVSMLPGNIARFVGSLKNMTYLTQLGLSGGYMIATPLQAFLLGPARHLQLTGQGFGHSALQTSIKSMYDFSLGLLGHEVKNTFNTKYDMPMTPIGKDAFRYMEDNGIITQNIFHEASGLGEYAPVHALKQGIGWTISMPEKIARAATFMSFAHHLDASGKFTTRAELFRRAEELTNHTLTDFRRMSRPLAVDKLGQAGELAYTYKSPVFNQYNSLGEFARDAMKGKPGPLLAALGMTALLGGAVSLPFVNEADEAWNLVKTGVAKTWPTMYPRVSGLGIKGTIISKMNELSANDKVQHAIGAGPAKFLGDTGGYGAVSAATGSQMASRFSSSIGDVSNPLGNIAPVGQEIKEWVGAGSSALNPTKNAATQAVYSAIAPPAVKGAMETHMDAFKTVKQAGGQGYANPNHLQEHNTAYVRTPDEEFKRNFGLTSLQEATTKSARYINQEEGARFKSAQDVAVDKMFDAVTRKDKPDVQKYARAYFDNNGDGDGFEKELDQKLDGYMFTPEQRAVIKAQSIAAIKNVIRMRKMQGKYAN